MKGLGWERALVQGLGGEGPWQSEGEQRSGRFGVLDGGLSHPSELGKCACYSSG